MNGYIILIAKVLKQSFFKRSRNFFGSLYWKATAILGLYLVFTMVAMGAIFFYLWVWSSDGIRQANAVSIASSFARQLQPLVETEVDPWKVQQLIDQIISTNPNLDPFLLDKNGNVIEFFSSVNWPFYQIVFNVDIRQLKRYFEAAPFLKFPIYGANPSSPSTPEIFAAAPLIIKGEPGYLYLGLKPEVQKKKDSFFTLTNFVSAGIIISSLFTLISWALGFSIFYFLTLRFQKLNAAVLRIASGEFSERVTVQKNDEIDQLGSSINSMAHRIEESIGELKRKDQLRRELIANVSHDLRGPVTLIGGYAETLVLDETSFDEKKAREIGGIIVKNVAALSRLLMELFELAKLEAREYAPKLQAFSIFEVASDIVYRYAPAAELRRIELSIKSPAELPHVMGELQMIERVLTNLVENALTYTLDDGIIQIRLTNLSDRVLVEVSDTGVGISASDLPNIFSKFFRVEKWESRRSSSGGLGLAIVKKIIEAHKSEIKVSSEENKGTTFSFELPAVL